MKHFDFDQETKWLQLEDKLDCVKEWSWAEIQTKIEAMFYI